ncbi:MAG: 2-oxoacid:acceptor oxidoreductase family protein [Kiritimatiellia bacterium]|nr:2-oxoacid:acceptor oxidoreductase family protein [Kiritimatiellia bacterium]
MKTIETRGMYPIFTRGGKQTRSTHYCAGCGHGIANKLIAEAYADLGLQDRIILVNPVGCGVFSYFYWDAGNVCAAHGRASAVATGVARARPDAVTLAYQGDGDLGAIGFNNAFQAASRGEHLAVIFVNNSIYGMTGGQMAPTTLLGQVTTTTPYGRCAVNEGYPLKVCEVINQLDAPVYIARVSVADPKRIMQAKQAIRRALQIQVEGKGYALIEILSPCPTNFTGNPQKAAEYCMTEMETIFPLGVFRDRASEVDPRPVPPEPKALEAIFAEDRQIEPPTTDSAFGELRMKFSGYGGQGILSLGHVLADAARLERRHVTWYPSYGPEQRGGSASCSVVVSGRAIGSPIVDSPDILVCMNRPAYERYIGTVKPGGLALVDASVDLDSSRHPVGVTVCSVAALGLAQEQGVPKAANTVMLGALLASGRTRLLPASLVEAFKYSFARKPKLVPKNLEILNLAAERYRLDSH